LDAAARRIVGWDIGGVQVKAASLAWGPVGEDDERLTACPLEIWRDPGALVDVLAQAAREVGAGGTEPAAVTMTAELSDAFRTKREGVLFVFDALKRVFPRAALLPLSIRGEFVPLAAARSRPLDFAATNWVASAMFVARYYPDCVLIDVGSTTTDVIPIVDGCVHAEGLTDTARLISGELIYTGLLRTNPNTLVEAVPLGGRMCRVAAEHFAIMADAYLLLGRIGESDYTCPTPDGRPATPEAAAERLARLVCADREFLGEDDVVDIGLFLLEKQLDRISDGLVQVLSRRGLRPDLPLVVVGVGSFLAAEVGRRLGRDVLEPAAGWAGRRAAVLPAVASARLLGSRLVEEDR
jgi:probable H4MPT-linked C1 transfer pathway protein